ncbi:hypothetical protein [Okeania sp.]|uniref:hypothetical protein n=1 Tax=Okeania sp. TaxID=3100323 RepID=UPI002B4B1BA3|nr:hypothetical protein [Okeania sp.]MEB3341524.1 hypothetical protein [Okeania sp.]
MCPRHTSHTLGFGYGSLLVKQGKSLDYLLRPNFLIVSAKTLPFRDDKSKKIGTFTKKEV